MLLYTESITPRLQYISGFAGTILTGHPIELTTDKEQYRRSGDARINYSPSRIEEEECWIRPHPLLFEQGISQQDISCFSIDHLKAFFPTGGDYPFDILAASFFLLSRYEEYLPHEKDMYGRYAHQNALAFREGFLEQPLINQWLQHFSSWFEKTNRGTDYTKRTFRFLPTYDIDIAWSFKEKGFIRNTGGIIRSLFKGEWTSFWDRLAVLQSRKQDPFDSYQYLHGLHQRFSISPVYFFLVANKTGKYDKNIPPGNKAMVELIRQHQSRYTVGIHPSWQSGDDELTLKAEIGRLQAITQKPVTISRQHYIRFLLPDGYRRLMANGIREDYSMGYGSINGFRASVADSFFWYDLEEERQTSLQIHPFCYMEANSYYEQHYSAEQALEEMRHYYRVIKEVKGTYIMIWHNNAVGTDPSFSGWREVYEKFLQELKS